MKKTVLFIGAIAIVLATVPMFAAFEAHIINVTAHIENALSVNSDHLDFGTVFPQEWLDRDFNLELSDSFLGQSRVNVVDYVIKQKPKCINAAGEYAPVDYATHECPDGYVVMNDLCEFLSKETEDRNDTEHPSYYVPGDPDTCQDVSQLPDATGRLVNNDDEQDDWTIDLKVPPVDGTVGQDWPGSCPTVAANDQDYGCDLWIEVTGISENTACGDGVLDSGEECETNEQCGPGAFCSHGPTPCHCVRSQVF